MAHAEVYQSDIIERCEIELAALLLPRQEFSDLIEDLDPHVCARVDLIAAIEVAPSRELRLYLYGVYQFREMLALAVGAKF
jgi:hypothetical protein